MLPAEARRTKTVIGRRTFLATGIAAAAAPAQAAPRSRLVSPRWRAFGTAAEPDHGTWDQVLRAGVSKGADGIARFNYAGTQHARVSDYLARLTATDPVTLPQAAAFAYWVNLYNALTVHVVLGAYPVQSIRDIGGGVFSRGPWRSKLVRIADQQLSLDDIEHGILRPIWRDPRIHYAVNCASLGCPDLAPRAYTASRLGRMLDAAARAYANHPRGAEVTERGLVVSSIYEWFKVDFGGDDAGVIAHLAKYAEPQKAAAIRAAGRIADDRYDWALND